METQTPTAGRILIAAGFAISCFALALFLWLAFGGAIPLKPEGYRFTVPFDEATNLAQESDVRISGVSVGKVKGVELSDEGDAEATIELDAAYAPIPENTRAILRQKTLLGETYVELTPGDGDGETLAEGDSLPIAQVSEAVQLDEVFRAFDPRTRAAFQAWMQGQSAALRGRGEDLSIAIASLDPFAEEANRALRLLDSQDAAVSGLLRESGDVFTALSERQGQLRGLIENANTVFSVTAERNEDLAEAFRIFPTFLRESRTTLTRLEQFADDTDPVVTALQPTARELTPTVRELDRLAPELQRFFVALRPMIAVSRDGFRATRSLLDDRLPPLLEGFDPWLAQVNPIFEVIRMYRREVTGALGNVTAATQGVFFNVGTSSDEHYLRSMAYLNPEAVAAYPRRLASNRTNPYSKPGSLLDIGSGGLKSFETRQCTGGINAILDPTSPLDPDFSARVGGDAERSQQFFDSIETFVFKDQPDAASTPRPPCTGQSPYNSVGSPAETSDYLHTYPFP
jgi:phospholipid/cholesterol/gamma-HCH transport system substrate-binding protein